MSKNLCCYTGVAPQYCRNIPLIIFWTYIARFLQYFRNLSNSFINIFAILQYFNGIFLKYSFNITVLVGRACLFLCLLCKWRRNVINGNRNRNWETFEHLKVSNQAAWMFIEDNERVFNQSFGSSSRIKRIWWNSLTRLIKMASCNRF